MSRCGKCEFEGYNHDCEELGIDNNICVAPYIINYCPYQIKYTNADKIREMSNEELLEFIKSINQVYKASRSDYVFVDFTAIGDSSLKSMR